MVQESTTVTSIVRSDLGRMIVEIEENLDADAMTYCGPIVWGSEYAVRAALEAFKTKRPRLVILLTTLGGVVEVVERMVHIIRSHYQEVVFVVSDRAMSAGTVFVMSGDAIMMDYFACLGPIDPQIEKDGQLVPALSYLAQFNRLIEKSKNGVLTTAEFALLNKLDLADLHQYEEARELSGELLQMWLTKFKFKNWNTTETRGIEVTEDMRRQRAKEIATRLSDNERWHSHSRGLSMQVLRDQLNIKIDDFGTNSGLASTIRDYSFCLADYMGRENMPRFVHTREFF